MAELSKQALKVENNTEFPNNNAGLITPTKLRGFNVDMIDSLVDEISYNVDSASWNQQIDSLENFTASLATNFVTTASFNSFTQSFNSFSASVTQSIVDLQNFSASLSGGFVTEGELQAATQSLINQINTKLDSASFNSYTQSTDNRLTNLEAATASINSSITQLNASSASQQISITNLNSATASLFTSTSLSLTTASFNNGTRNLTFSKGDGTTFSVNIPDVSGSAGNFVTTSSFNAYTQSNDQRVSSLEANSASVNISISNLNTATASLFTSASLGLTTASVSLNTLTFRKGDGTTFNLTVDTGSGQAVPAGTISGSAQITAFGFVSSSVTASSLITASVAGADITFTKGDGSTFVITTATGSVASASFAETASLATNALDIIVNVKNTTGVQINKGTVVRIIGATGDNALIGTASWTDDGQSANTLGFVTADIPNDSFGRVMTQGTLLGINTDGYTAGQLIYLSSSGQYTNIKPDAPYHEVRLGQVLRVQQNNGSVYVLIQNGYELDELHDVDINTGSLANNNLLAYNSTTGQWENKTLTQVGATTTASFNAYTQSTDNRLTNIESTTASLNTSITNINSFTQSANSRLNNIEARTGSYATTGSNAFFGNNSFSGSLAFTGSAINLLSASTSGTIITNLTDTFTDVSRVQQIVTLTSASYASLVTGSLTNPNTLYIVSGSTQVNPAFPYTGSAVITGSLTITGSAVGNVVSMSISSNTASMDLNAGNYFVLTSSVTPLRIELSNIKGGVTSTLIISASASSSITFGSNVAQPSGSAYSGSAGSIDILSFVAFNTSKVNVVSTKALV